MATPNPNAVTQIPADHPFKQGVAVVMHIYVSAPPDYQMASKRVAIFVREVKDGVVTYLDGLQPEAKTRRLIEFYTNAPRDSEGQLLLPYHLQWGSKEDKAVEKALRRGLAKQKTALTAMLNAYPNWVSI